MFIVINLSVKNDVLISQDGSNDCIGFVESGLLRSYKINEQGDDITCHFFEEGSFFVDLLSFNSSPYSSVSIEAITDSKVYIFNSETFNTFSSFWSNELSSLSNLKQILFFIVSSNRNIFCDTYPNLFK